MEKVYDMTRIDLLVLSKFRTDQGGGESRKLGLADFTYEVMFGLKRKGFSDARLAKPVRCQIGKTLRKPAVTIRCSGPFMFIDVRAAGICPSTAPWAYPHTKMLKVPAIK